ncbi:xanthine dehydrogenase family protein molybdopterin-binding subunit [Ferrimonas senticii]|uniref:xanthine dehydrogenase family protein molybdopterin-binding subunit n=1 Tax=Ferrimonas senticii TaxID=394566 RepID=UPI00040B7E5C|nr:xanthine dehydrogenase family protein molybdopterin-binding subunit [Ferrimonas senticii]
MHDLNQVDRRQFLKLAGGSGALMLAVPLSLASEATAPAAATPLLDTNAFVKLSSDGSVEVVCKHLEMGQGAYTAMGVLVAEELDVPLADVTVVEAPNAVVYSHTQWGGVQGTGGSTGLSNSYLQMRAVGASMRQMLLAAAAAKWGVDKASLSTDNGMVVGAGVRASYGELAAAAAQQPVPQPADFALKNPQQFRYIGQKVERLDHGKLDGKAKFTQDLHFDGMLTAVVIHPPRFGAKLSSFDAAAAEAMPGVHKVVAAGQGIAVIADNYWLAHSARKKVKAQWDERGAASFSNEQMMAELSELAKGQGAVAQERGDLAAGFANAATVIEEEFQFPLLAHATMEPMNCVAEVSDGACELWTGAQLPTIDQTLVAKALGINPENIKIHTLIAGGSFGRRGCPGSDYIVEAAQIAATMPKQKIKMVWAREDDMRAGWYRPCSVQRIKVGLDKQGDLIAWQHHIAGPSVIKGTLFEPMMLKNGVDHTSVEGAIGLPYKVANLGIFNTLHNTQIPVQWWRSVGHSHNGYVKEVMIDKAARSAGKDPLQYRLDLLQNPRDINVLKRAAAGIGYGKPKAEGEGIGLAVHFSFESYVAVAVKVKMDGNKVKVTKAYICVDCGLAVNPDVVVAQMQGGMAFGLAMALHSQLTVKNGAIKESNFHNYKVARIRDMPEVEVEVVASAEPPTGVGEPATAVIAPAVANAIADISGNYPTKLPLHG